MSRFALLLLLTAAASCVSRPSHLQPRPSAAADLSPPHSRIGDGPLPESAIGSAISSFVKDDIKLYFNGRLPDLLKARFGAASLCAFSQPMSRVATEK